MQAEKNKENYILDFVTKNKMHVLNFNALWVRCFFFYYTYFFFFI